MSNAVLYLRVSTVDQAKRGHEPEGYSIPAQREACLRKARQLEADVAEEFVDRGESARSANRPELKRLIAHLATHQVKYVIVHKLDRLARNLADHVEITMAIRKAGAELVSVVESIDDTPLGEYMQTIFAANAQLYSANLAEEAKKGLHQKAKLGGTPGLAPLGYLNVREVIEGREVRTVRVDPERGPHIQWAFTAYATGAYTLDTLTEALEDRGLVTRPGRNKPAKPVSRTTLSKILDNPYYIGTIRYGGKIYEGRHERLINAETFAEAQAILQAHSNAEERDRKHHHFLKGSVYCGKCGSRLTISKNKGNGGTYMYYACIGRIRGNGCDQRYVPVDRVEEEVVKAYGKHAARFRKRNLARTRQQLDKAVGGMRDQAERQLRRQRLRLSKVETEKERLLHAYYENAIPVELLKREQERLAGEQLQAEASIEVAERSAHEVGEILGKAMDLLDCFGPSYELADHHLKRRWNQALFTRFELVDDEVLESELAEPFKSLATLHAAPARRKSQNGRSSAGHGSNKKVLVGATGFEPATFRPSRWIGL